MSPFCPDIKVKITFMHLLFYSFCHLINIGFVAYREIRLEIILVKVFSSCVTPKSAHLKQIGLNSTIIETPKISVFGPKIVFL